MTAKRPALTVLALNSGSSSLKFGLYRATHPAVETLFSGSAESIGAASGEFRVRDAQGRVVLSETFPLRDQRDACARVVRLFDSPGLPAPEAVGHRVVHGGIHLRRHCVIDDDVMRKLEAAAGFAPLHVPMALSTIRLMQGAFPRLTQVACFDTAFHAGMPDVARTLPLPGKWRAEGMQRFGFHGLSCESILYRLGRRVPSRLVIAHLGSGASVTAVKDGNSVDNSMGMTPSGGVMMATRCGDIDPGVLAYLVREKQFEAPALEDLIDHRSGMLGVSAVSGDLRRLREVAASNADARLAIGMFTYSVRKQVAAMAAVLGGLELLVFTGGIGQHDAAARAEICDGLAWCGIALDARRNRESVDPVSRPGSPCAVRVLASEEEVQIARHVRGLVA